MKIIHVFVDTVVVDQQTNAGISVNDIMALVYNDLEQWKKNMKCRLKRLKNTITPQKDDFSFAKATGKI